MEFRAKLAAWLDRASVRNAILGVIVANAILLGMETSHPLMAAYGPLIEALDRACLAIFVAEIAAKLVAHGPRFFRSGWNLFDFVIVGVSVLPGAQTLSVLRALRILRVLRVISALPRLRRVVEGFITALPGMASVFLLMGLVFYIGAVMATKLFGAGFPDYFGTLPRSAFTLFQIMTLEGWAMEVVRPVMAEHPYAWAFFVPFIMVTTFAVVNLLVGLIVNSMHTAHSEEETKETDAHRDAVLSRLEAIERRLTERENQPPTSRVAGN